MLRAEDLLIIVSAIACGGSGVRYVRNKGDQENRDKVYSLWHLGMVGIGAAVAFMLCYLVEQYFEFSYVYEHTSLDLPFIYRISALWAGKEGSFLLWSFIAVGMGYTVLKMSYRPKDISVKAVEKCAAKQQRKCLEKNHRKSFDKAFPVYSAITVALLVMSVVMRPFKMLSVPVTDGQGLSRALQDPWMVVHPPLVFVGYTAMAIMFAVGMNDLRNGQYEGIIKNWARKSMLFLGLGIMTGSVWAYRALGWGGYWAWDPIENIALVPWLLLCAYSHSYSNSHSNSNRHSNNNNNQIMFNKVDSRLGSFSNIKRSGSEEGTINWTKDKCVLPFAIAIFGTFLVRSGLLANASAHAYVGEMAKGRFIILGAFIIAIVSMIGWAFLGTARSKIKLDYRAYFRGVTYIYAYAILVGTVCPLFIKVQVSNYFYNRLTIAYVVANSLLILGIERERIGRKLGISLTLGAVISVAMARYFDYRSVGLTLVLWIVLIPLLGYILTGLKKRNHYYYWTHVLLLVMLVGGITSAGMGGQFMEKVGEQAPISMLSRMLEDRVIEQKDGVNPYEEENMVLYTTKPLINLFWLGSFGLLGVMVGKVVKAQRNIG